MTAILVPGRHTPGTASRIGAGIVDLKITGDKGIIRDLSKNFEPTLKELLKNGAFAGTFSVYVRTKVRGSSATKGLRVGGVNRDGVLITWHEGDNSNRIEMLLYRPGDGDVDVLGFQNRLINASVRMDEADDAEDSDPPPANSPPPLNANNGKSGGTSPPEAPTRSQERFVDGADNVQLFMLEIAPHLSADGRVTRTICGHTLSAAFGYHGRGNGAIIRSLVKAGHLLAVDAVWVRVSAGWLGEIRPAPAQPVVSADALAGLERLLATESEVPQLRAKLAELELGIADQDERIADLQKGRERLVAERDAIKAKLENPVLSRALGMLDELRKLGAL
ncbi:MAG TPA: hypothetical protein VN495_03470 [Candidatus Paceibacterota bacterium]|nr:hypothetical protein [Candidatus Paceibacterota bacterium]